MHACRVVGSVVSVVVMGAVSGLGGTSAAASCWHPEGNVEVVKLGDINGSGAVNVADISCILLAVSSSLANKPQPACVAGPKIGLDLDCDGVSTVGDATLAIHVALSGKLPLAVDPLQTGCHTACTPCAEPGTPTCLIAQVCVVQAQPHPTQDCRACLTATSANAWSVVADGVMCSEGICEAGECVAGGPSPPTSVSAVAGDASATVSFAPPASLGSGTLVEYEIEVMPGGAIAAAAGSPAIVGGLANGVAVSFRVRVVTTAGVSEWSAPSAPVTPAPCLGEANGTPCDDGNPCTQQSACSGGACVGSSPVTCSGSATSCLNAPSCDPQTGSCVQTPKANGLPCDDANACTSGTQCVGGACGGGTSVVCPTIECRQAGQCDAVTADCVYPNAPAGSPCSDGDVCTSGDTCMLGQCIPGTPVPCCDVSGAAHDLTYVGGLVPETAMQVKVDQHVPGRLHATTVTHRVYRSDDFGQTWQLMCTAANFASQGGKLLQSPASDATVYVRSSSTAYRVTDSAGGPCPAIGDVFSSHFHAGGLAVDATGRVYRWSNAGLHFSDDRGVSWAAMPGYWPSEARSFAIDPSDPSRIVSMHNGTASITGGVYVNTTWVNSYFGLSSRVLFHPTTPSWIFLGQGGRYSSNGGTTWATSSAHQVWVLDGLGRGYRLLSAHSGAATEVSRAAELRQASPAWTAVAVLAEPWGNNFSLDAVGSTIAVVAQGRLYASADDGVTFAERTPYRLNQPVPTSSVVAAGGAVYAAVDWGTILRSHDEGNTWDLAQYYPPATLNQYTHLELAKGNPDHLYARSQRWDLTTGSAYLVVTLDGFDSSHIVTHDGQSCCSNSGNQSIFGLADGADYGTFGSAGTSQEFHTSFDSGLSFHKRVYHGVANTTGFRWTQGFWSPYEERAAYYGYGDSLMRFDGRSSAVSGLPFANPAGMDFVRDPNGAWRMRVISNDGKIAESVDGQQFTLAASTGGLSGGTNSRRIFASLEGRPEVIATALLPSAHEVALSLNGGQSWVTIPVPGCLVRAVALSHTRMFVACQQADSVGRVVNIDSMLGCGPGSVLPGPPTGVAAAVAGTSATVSFQAPAATGGTPIIGYEVVPMEGGPTAGGVGSPIAVSGLQPGPWRFRVRARNAAGLGPLSLPSAEVEVAVPLAATPPGPPSDVVTTPRSTALEVEFMPPADDGGASVTSFDVDCTSANGGAPLSATVGGNPAVLASPTPNATYICTVGATNSVGSGPVGGASGATWGAELLTTAEPFRPPGVERPVRTSTVDVDPGDPLHMLALDVEGMVHETFDAGQTWSRLCYFAQEGSWNYGRVFFSADGSTAYARWDYSLYRVEDRDGGQCPPTGLRLLPGFSHLRDTEAIAGGKLVVWAPAGLEVSSDRGISFRRMAGFEGSGTASLGVDPHGVMDVVSIHDNAPASGYSMGVGVYVGTERVPSLATINATGHRVYFHATQPGYVYLGSGGVGAAGYFSVNGGLAWSTSTAPNGASAIDGQGRGLRLQVSGDDLLLRRAPNAFVVSPSWSTLYTFATVNQGDWSSAPPSQVVAQGMMVVVVHRGRLFVSTDDGMSFAERLPLSNRLSADSVAISGGLLYAIGLGGAVIRSDDDGVSWTLKQWLPHVFARAEGLLEPVPGHPGTFYARNEAWWWSTLKSGFAFTSDEFESLDAVIPTGLGTTGANMSASIALAATSRVNPQVYYWFGNNKVVRTMDGGATFQFQSTAFTGNPFDWTSMPIPRAYVSPLNQDRVLYGVGDFSSSFREYNYATNQSASVTSRLPFLNPAGMHMYVSPEGDSSLFVISRTGEVAVSPDGVTFTLVAGSGGLTVRYNRLLAVLDSDPSVMATVGHIEGNLSTLALSFTGGATWQTLNLTQCGVPRDVVLTESHILLACGSIGGSGLVAKPIHAIRYDTLAP